MRLATFNVENLFDRVKAFEGPSPEANAEVLDAFAELNGLFERPSYSAAAKARMLALMESLGILRGDEGPFVWLRRIRGRLVRRPRSGPPEVVAGGRGDWIGWAELKTAQVDETAIRNTARVIADAGADVVALVEVESRPVMLDFHEYLYLPTGGPPYDQMMLIDGNDARGIDVGLMLQPGYRIVSMLSHVDERLPGGARVFSRDSPEYTIATPSGETLTLLPNHFKSKFGGNDAASRARRLAQATAVAGYVRRLTDEGQPNVAVAGDLNDTPDSEALAPLLATGLREITEHPAFTEFTFEADQGGRGIGTYGTGSDRNKIDYILLTPALWERVTRGGIFRKGAWTASGRWPMYDTLTRPEQAASDHHLLWADLDL